MSENHKQAVFTATVAIICFAALADMFFNYTMMAVKAILFCLGTICALGFIACISDIIKPELKEISTLIRSSTTSAIVNILTLYRIIASPIILFLLYIDSPACKWLLLSAFITDVLDGFFARYWKVTSKLGAMLDSLADDILFIVCIVFLITLHPTALTSHTLIISITLILFFIKTAVLYYRHKKVISGMHTYLNKYAAFMQALFFVDCMFFGPNSFLFYIAIFSTILALVEEIIIISTFKILKENIKGILFNKT